MLEPALVQRIAAVRVPARDAMPWQWAWTSRRARDVATLVLLAVAMAVAVIIRRATFTNATEPVGIERVRQLVDERKPHIHATAADPQRVLLVAQHVTAGRLADEA